ncbi:MAG TPA: hypothetical protein VF610_01665 [Segetibacter sp.]|jgi:hypothetical protein
MRAILTEFYRRSIYTLKDVIQNSLTFDYHFLEINHFSYGKVFNKEYVLQMLLAYVEGKILDELIKLILILFDVIAG